MQNPLRFITVEPVLLMYMTATLMMTPVLQQTIYYKLCYQFHNASICDNLEDNKHVEYEIQEQAAQWYLYITVCISAPAIFISFFVGPWSDRVGRRLPMCLPPVGGLLYALSFLVQSLDQFLLTIPVEWTLIGALAQGFLGGYTVIILTTYSYLADVTTEENRTRRMSILTAMLTISGTIGLGIGGVLVDNFGFFVVFAVCMGLHVINFIYIWARLREKKRDENSQVTKVNCSYVMNTLKVVTKIRPNNGRLHLILLFLCLFIYALCNTGVNEIAILFTKRVEIDMSNSNYGYWQATRNLVPAVFLMLLLPLLSRWFSDTTLAAIGAVSSVGMFELMAFSVNEAMLWATVAVGAFNGFLNGVLHGTMSKTVSDDEQGAMFSILSMLETVTVVVSAFIFNNIYPVTLPTFAGFPFMLMAVMFWVSLVFVVWIELSSPFSPKKTETTAAAPEIQLRERTASMRSVASG
ncbi:proton-coupled folate transporter-like [Branchiostoma lanceolatum]|uniref:proton-coupled folate transporter-like n=1 Tax=Branchiostoma lanceolatum TaxID=7740 RepID=UPI003456D78F